MSHLLDPLEFPHGRSMKNRFMLAPLTNTQSNSDGTLAEEEFRWLTMRAEGGFGLTMTCAANVQAVGQGFPGQLGIYSDDHIEGLSRLARGINDNDSVSIVQLHHAGMRAPRELISGVPVCPSDNEETGARELSSQEVKQLIDDFIAGAVRSEKAGFDGVEIHGAHGYVVCQFLSSEINRRTDSYGGSPANRARLLNEIIEGIRARCDPDFIVGVRLSPERFGMQLSEITELAQELMASPHLDFLDMSLWDSFKEPAEEQYQGRSLLSYFTELERGNVRLGVAGNIWTPADAERVMSQGVDWVMLGRVAIVHHDFPNRYHQDRNFTPLSLPVTRQHLASEGLSERFLHYMGARPGFIAD